MSQSWQSSQADPGTEGQTTVMAAGVSPVMGAHGVIMPPVCPHSEPQPASSSGLGAGSAVRSRARYPDREGHSAVPCRRGERPRGAGQRDDRRRRERSPRAGSPPRRAGGGPRQKPAGTPSAAPTAACTRPCAAGRTRERRRSRRLSLCGCREPASGPSAGTAPVRPPQQRPTGMDVPRRGRTREAHRRRG